MSKSWINVTILDESVIFTFKENRELLISTNGFVSKNFYEVMPDGRSVTLTKDNLTVHFEIIYHDYDFITLSPHNNPERLILINYNKYNELLKGRLDKQNLLKTTFIEEAVKRYVNKE